MLASKSDAKVSAGFAAASVVLPAGLRAVVAVDM
jgi:hypothetical protein